MRVNIYAEEMTERVEIISKEIEGHTFTGLRLYLYLPVTVNGKQQQGPFLHREGDDDSSAITFWGKRDLRKLLKVMQTKLDEHYRVTPPPLFGEQTEPSSEGVGQGEVAGAAPGLPEEPAWYDSTGRRTTSLSHATYIMKPDYDTLRTLYLRAVAERNEAWAALRPFAALRQPHQDNLRPQTPIFGINGADITKADLDAAVAAIAAARGGK